MALDKEVIHMKKEIRTVVYDDELRIEAYRFEGIVQPFPSHFHVKKIPRNGITSFVFTYMDYFLGMKSKKVLKLIAQQLTVPSIRGIIPIPMV